MYDKGRGRVVRWKEMDDMEQNGRERERERRRRHSEKLIKRVGREK